MVRREYAVFRRLMGTAYGMSKVSRDYPSRTAAVNRKRQALQGGKKFKNQRKDDDWFNYLVD
jgi:hypothetical protein